MSYESRDRIAQQRRVDAGSPLVSRAAAILRLRGRASSAPPAMAAEDRFAPVAAAVTAARALERGFWICY